MLDVADMETPDDCQDDGDVVYFRHVKSCSLLSIF